MRKIGSLIVALLCACTFVKAQKKFEPSQDFEVSLSEPHRVVDARHKLYQHSDDYVVSLKLTKRGKMILQSFRADDLGEIAMTEVEQFDPDMDIEYFTEFNDRFYVFYTIYDKPNKIENLYLAEIDPASATFIEKGRLLISVNGKLAGTLVGNGWTKVKSTDKFRFEKSKSENFLMVRYRKLPDEKKDHLNKDVIGLFVFDSEIQEEWKVEKLMDKTEAEMYFYDFTVDSEGNAYILAKVYNTNERKDQLVKGSEKLNYHLELIKIERDADDFEQMKFELDDNHFINDLILYEKDNDNLVIGGYYETGLSRLIAGLFVFNIDKNDGEMQKEYYPLPHEVINAFESKRQKRKNGRKSDKGDVGMSSRLYLEALFVDDEGNIILVGEEYWTETTYYTDSKGRQKTKVEYFYGDILAARISADSELTWVEKIPKLQVGTNGMGGMSYSTLRNDESFYILYVDHAANLHMDEHDKPKRYIDRSVGVFSAVKIDMESGNRTKHHIFSTKSVNGVNVSQFFTGRIEKISDQEFAVELYKKQKEDVWVRIKLK